MQKIELPKVVDKTFIDNLENELKNLTIKKVISDNVYFGNQNRAIELSLYYVGYSAEIFGKIDYYIPPDMWEYSPRKSIRNLKRGKIRDAKKRCLTRKFLNL